jgi:hypothetical protein
MTKASVEMIGHGMSLIDAGLGDFGPWRDHHTSWLAENIQRQPTPDELVWAKTEYERCKNLLTNGKASRTWAPRS